MLAVQLAAPLVALLALSVAAVDYNQTVLLMGIPGSPRVRLPYTYEVRDKQCSAHFPGHLMGCAVMPPKALQVELRSREIYPTIKIKPDLTDFVVRRHSRDCRGTVSINVEVSCERAETRRENYDDLQDESLRRPAIPLEP